MRLFERGNGALAANSNTVNGATADIAITVRGSDWYWTVCACMTVATFTFIGLGLAKPRSHRIFNYITAGVTMVAAIAYFTMGSNLGFTPIQVEFPRSNPVVSGTYREVFYVRYIDWVITTPLLLLDLLLTAAIPLPTILFTILVDEVMIITGLIGALVVSQYKWAYWVFGDIALVYIVYMLVWEARRHAAALGKDVGRVFLMCGTLTAFLWILYPVAWGLCEGGNVISGDSEAIFYGILDLFAKPGFGILLLIGHRNIDPARLGIHIRDYNETDALINGSEKHHHGTNGASNGATNGTGVNGTNNTATETV